MNRLPQNTVNRIESSPVSWLNFSDLVEPIIEQTLTWFEVLGYTVLLQSDIVSGRHQSILQHYHNGMLVDRLYPALRRINPTASQPQLEDILHQLAAPRTQPIVLQNRQWHGQLLQGIPVSSRIDPQSQSLIKLVDFDHLLNNDWLVTRSFPVVEADHQRCLNLEIIRHQIGFQQGRTKLTKRLQPYPFSTMRSHHSNAIVSMSMVHRCQSGYAHPNDRLS